MGGSATGWKIATAGVAGYPYLVLIGSILVLASGLVVLMLPKLKSLGVLLAFGGLIIIIGAALGIWDIWGKMSEFSGYLGLVGMVPGIDASINYGYGIFVSLIGGALCIVGATKGAPKVRGERAWPD